jgi:hypothetical protein
LRRESEEQAEDLAVERVLDELTFDAQEETES